jgi:hypothetical protein
MIIDRLEDQGNKENAKIRVSFCLDQLEKASDFKHKLDWDVDIVSRLTLEEVIGALISAEQALKEYEEELKDCEEDLYDE